VALSANAVDRNLHSSNAATVEEIQYAMTRTIQQAILGCDCRQGGGDRLCDGIHLMKNSSIESSRRVLPHAAEMLERLAGVLAVLYLLGAVVFGVALLFYTFSR
jgi:hypothetical protein